MEIVNHKYAINHRDVFKTMKGKLCVVLDYHEKGDLNRVIK